MKKLSEIDMIGQELRRKIESRRNRLFRLDQSSEGNQYPEKVDTIIRKPSSDVSGVPETKSDTNILESLSQLEQELDLLTQKPINLSEKYGVTGAKVVALGGIMGKVDPQEFEHKSYLPHLDIGMMMKITLDGFEYFDILSICTTQKGQNICVVNFKPIGGKKGQTDLIILFPLEEGKKLKMYSSRTQEPYSEYTIHTISQTRRNLFARVLSTFGFIK